MKAIRKLCVMILIAAFAVQYAQSAPSYAIVLRNLSPYREINYYPEEAVTTSTIVYATVGYSNWTEIIESSVQMDLGWDSTFLTMSFNSPEGVMAYNVLFSNAVGELDDLVVAPSYASVFPNPVQECKPVTVSYRPNNGPLWDATNVTVIINPGVDIERKMTYDSASSNWVATIDNINPGYSDTHIRFTDGVTYDRSSRAGWLFPATNCTVSSDAFTEAFPQLACTNITIGYTPNDDVLSGSTNLYARIGWNDWSETFTPSTQMYFSVQDTNWLVDLHTTPDDVSAYNINVLFSNDAGMVDQYLGEGWSFAVAICPEVSGSNTAFTIPELLLSCENAWLWYTPGDDGVMTGTTSLFAHVYYDLGTGIVQASLPMSFNEVSTNWNVALDIPDHSTNLVTTFSNSVGVVDEYLGTGWTFAVSNCLNGATSEVAYATNRYVSLSGSSISPYTNWVNAATNIQLAIDIALDGETVWVAPGVYSNNYSSNTFGRSRVIVKSGVELRSASSNRSDTIIQGYRTDISNQVRCVYLEPGSLISGFTLVDGGARSGLNFVSGTYGGGIFYGGGILMGEGAASVDNCVVRNCIADKGGGIAGSTYPGHTTSNFCFVSNSLIEGNQSVGWNYGGGVLAIHIVNSTIQSNIADSGGGVAHCIAERCIIRRNTADAGGGVYGTDEMPGRNYLYNCLIVENSARIGVGLGSSDTRVTAYNCTLWNFENSYYGREAYDSVLINCLVRGPGGIHESSLDNTVHSGDPYLFMDVANADYRPHPASPAIDACSISNLPTGYQAFADLRGKPRIVGTSIDAGAYEFQGECDGGIPSQWLDDYSLVTNQTANFLDPDNDTFNTWHEFIAQTIPTNSQSYPRLIGHIDNNQNSPTLTWAAYSNRTYTIQSLGALTSAWQNTFSVSVNSNYIRTLNLTNPPNTGGYRLLIELSK